MKTVHMIWLGLWAFVFVSGTSFGEPLTSGTEMNTNYAIDCIACKAEASRNQVKEGIAESTAPGNIQGQGTDAQKGDI